MIDLAKCFLLYILVNSFHICKSTDKSTHLCHVKQCIALFLIRKFQHLNIEVCYGNMYSTYALKSFYDLIPVKDSLECFIFNIWWLFEDEFEVILLEEYILARTNQRVQGPIFVNDFNGRSLGVLELSKKVVRIGWWRYNHGSQLEKMLKMKCIMLK